MTESSYALKIGERIPRHVAIIMDGNGRWAKARGKIRIFGHHAGVGAVRSSVQRAAELGVKVAYEAHLYAVLHEAGELLPDGDAEELHEPAHLRLRTVPVLAGEGKERQDLHPELGGTLHGAAGTICTGTPFFSFSSSASTRPPSVS